MLIVKPDFARRIDLAGVGPCPRPVDIDRSHTGFSDLVSLRVYSFARDMVIDGEADGDEVFIVALRGEADVRVDQDRRRTGAFTLRAGGGSRAMYLPPHAAYRLRALVDCDIAYARAQPPASPPPPPRAFVPDGDRLDVADHARAMALSLATVKPGETLLLDGHDERFLHIRIDDGGTATLSERPIGDWESAALGASDRAMLRSEQGNIDVLLVSATARHGFSNEQDH